MENFRRYSAPSATLYDAPEIPTFQIISTLDANGDGIVDDAEKSAYAKQRLEALSGHLSLTLNGAGVPIRVGSSSFDLLPGQAELQISRLAAWLEPADANVTARLRETDVRLDYRDDNDPDRVGWREVIVQSRSGVRILDSSVPAADVSDELQAYPTDMLTAPLDRRTAKATCRVDPSGSSLVTSFTAANRTTASASGSPPIPIPSLFGQSSALVLLLGAIAVGQMGFGLILVAVFSLGLALVLTSVGIALVYAGRLITTDRLNRVGSVRLLLQAAPIGSALVISAIVLNVSLQALVQTGVLAGRI